MNDYQTNTSVEIIKEFRQFKKELEDIPINKNLVTIQIAYIPLWPDNYSSDTFGLPSKKMVYFYRLAPVNGNGNLFTEIGREDCPGDNEQSDFWKEKLKTHFPAQPNKYKCVLVWGHAFGYGFFQEMISTSQDGSVHFKEKYLEIMNQEKGKLLPMGNWILPPKEICRKMDTLQSLKAILRMEELALALEGAYGKQGVDILIGHACEIANIYTLYALRNTCMYFLGPQTAIGIPGYNFPEIFSEINQGRPISPRKLLEYLVYTFPSNANNRIKYQKEIEETGLSAIDISKVENIIEVIESLILHINSNTTKFSKIQLFNIRNKVPPIVGGNFYQMDILSWIRRLKDNFPYLSKLSKKIIILEKAIEESMVYSFKGKNINQYKTTKNRINFNSEEPGGISIFYPVKNGYDDGIQMTFTICNPVPFIKDYPWWKEFYTNQME